jgi:hypothetical protein
MRAGRILCTLALVLVSIAASSQATDSGHRDIHSLDHREASSAANCTRTSVGFTPLIDLGSSQYKGFPGLLYNGSNSRPSAHDAAGLALAKAIQPMDVNGNPDPTGKFVLLSIGMSNTNQEFGAFLPIGNAEQGKDPALRIVNGAQGGQDAQKIKDPNATFWQNIDTMLGNAGLSAKQVAAVWFKEADAGPNLAFPADAKKLQDEFVIIMGIMKSRYPNLAVTYLTSRIYAGYADTNLNPEPYAYQSGFAVKWLLEQQISGDPALNYDPAKGAVKSSWLSWGPYTWADGLKPRSDGLIWECKDFNNDGTHPNTTGRAKVANMLMNFFRNDSTSREWFYAGPPPPPPPPPNAAPKVESTAAATWPARKALDVQAKVTDNDTTKVEVTYTNSEGGSGTVALTKDSGGATQSNWSGQIPATAWPGSVRYSILAVDSKSQTGRWPASGDAVTKFIDPAPPAIAHEQKATEAVRGKTVTFEATATDELGIDDVSMLAWAPGDSTPTSWKMSLSSGDNQSGVWTASLEMPDADGKFRYAFTASDSTHESRQPATGEFEIALKAEGGGPGPGPGGGGGSGGLDATSLSIAGLVIVAAVAAAVVGSILWRRKRKRQQEAALRGSHP